MERCKTCKEWNSERCTDHPVFGVCESKKLWPKNDHPASLRGRGMDELAYDARRMPRFSLVYTGMDFGCVHHEPKEPTDEELGQMQLDHLM